jgi:hypothetical protein
LGIISTSALTTQKTFGYTVLAKSPDGCPATAPYFLTIRPKLSDLIQTTYTDTICPAGSATLDLRAHSIVHYAIQPNNMPGIAENPAQVFTASQPGLPERAVTYYLQATGQGFCAAQVLYHVIVQDKPEKCAPLLIPNIVTPNADGANDLLAIQGITPGTGKLEIYNSWGSQVLKDNAYANTWPDANVRPGLYYIKLEIPTRGQDSYKGWVEVQR